MMEEDDEEILQVTTVLQQEEPVDRRELENGPAEIMGADHLEEVDLVRESDALVTIEPDQSGPKDDAKQPSPGQSPVAVKVEEEEDTLKPEELSRRLRQMERDRGQLTAEILDKDQSLGSLECEVASLKAALAQRDEDHGLALEEAAARHKRLQEETSAKIEELKKQFSIANREKESMVMKYALGEKEVIIQRKGKEEAEKKLKVTAKERDDLLAKVKTLTSEKNKVMQLADSRLQDMLVVKKDVERWKEEVKIQESKSCVTASRLKAEMDAHRESRDQLEKTIKHLSETRQEIDVTRKECAEFMQRIRDDDEQKRKKTKTTEIEQSAKMIIDAAAASELDSIREKYRKVIDENNSFSQKIQKMERERLENAETIGRLKETVASQKQEISDLLSQVAEMESLRMQLSRSEEKNDVKAIEVERLRSEAAELNADMSACRAKEAELLEFTQKLTDKNVTLQSDHATLEARASALEAEHARLAGSVGELQTNCSQTRIELEEERKRRKTETELLAKKLAEKVKQVEVLSQQTLDAENEVRVLKRKNAANQKELTRELQSCKRRLDEREASPIGGLSHSSRTSSSNSLNRVEDQLVGSNGSYHKASSLAVPHSVETNGLSSITSYRVGERTHQVMVPDTQVMVEKICSMQKSIKKNQERMEFMEEHIATLLEDIKKKHKIIQQYVMSMETGVLSTAESDKNKRKMSESGGIMASLYTSKLSDASMTLELSLEINQKLQAVLEDTLLKNITLKENINTLGNEIAKISTTKPSR